MELNASPAELKTHADELYAKQDYAAAADAYRRLLETQPNSSSVMRSLGLSLVLSKNVEEGLQVCKTAAAIQPADAEVRYAYGYALGAAQRYDEAVPEFDAALGLQPNHVPAKQGLIYCLLTGGQAMVEADPQGAEQRLDRAHKLDVRNPHVTGTLLDLYVKLGQRGKAVKLIQSLDDAMRQQSPLKEQISTLENDSEYRNQLRQVAVAQRAAPPSVTPASAPVPNSTLKQVPCPNCKQMIMDYAAICPHCNFRIRATGTFAGRDTGPTYEWQEIAYTIMSILYTLLAVGDLISILPGAQKEGFSGLMTFLLVIVGARLIVGLGLIFRQEWIAFIAKILCYITLFTSAYSIMLFLGFKAWGALAISIFNIGVAGFMVYLINYVMGD